MSLSDINNSDDERQSIPPLHHASKLGTVDIVRQLLGAGANVNEATTDNCETPLYVASQNGHADVVKVLLDAGANPNQAASNGHLPLYVASHNGHADVVKVLIDVGAKLFDRMLSSSIIKRE